MQCSRLPFASFFLSSPETPAEELIRKSDRKYLTREIKKLKTKFDITEPTQDCLDELRDLLILSKARMIRLNLTESTHDSFTAQEKAIDKMLELKSEGYGINNLMRHKRHSNKRYRSHNTYDLCMMYSDSGAWDRLNPRNIERKLADNKKELDEHYAKKSSSANNGDGYTEAWRSK